MILLFHGYLIRCFEQRNSYFWLFSEINSYDHEKIITKVLCDNVNYTINVIETINYLTIVNTFFILCCMHGIELDGILRKNKNCIIVDDVI